MSLKSIPENQYFLSAFHPDSVDFKDIARSVQPNHRESCFLSQEQIEKSVVFRILLSGVL